MVIRTARYFALDNHLIIGAVDAYIVEVVLRLVAHPDVNPMPACVVRIAIGIMDVTVVSERQGYFDVSRKVLFGVEPEYVGIGAGTRILIRRAGVWISCPGGTCLAKQRTAGHVPVWRVDAIRIPVRILICDQ